MPRTVLAIVVLMLTACASTHMKQYVGRDIREVMLDSGPPINAFDMQDGTRAFQFRWGGGTFTVPKTTTTSGTVTGVGNSTWFQSQSITTGGGTFTSEGCVITYFSTWNAQSNGWVVASYRVPKQLVC